MSSAARSSMCFLRKALDAEWTFLLPSLVAAARIHSFPAMTLRRRQVQARPRSCRPRELLLAGRETVCHSSVPNRIYSVDDDVVSTRSAAPVCSCRVKDGADRASNDADVSSAPYQPPSEFSSLRLEGWRVRRDFPRRHTATSPHGGLYAVTSLGGSA
jgi:hypothetical protein